MKLFVICLTLSVSGCGFDVPDKPICRALKTMPVTTDTKEYGKITLQRPNPTCQKEIGEPYCGYCVWTISDKTQYVGNQWNHLLEIDKKKKTWDTVLAQAGLIPPETISALKAFTINACKATGKCNGQIDHWKVKFDALDSIGDSLK